jgi:DNA topoisomerase-1
MGKSTGVSCPADDCNGELVEKTSRRGKIFYGCNRFPKCDYALWDKPINKKCPVCSVGFLTEKTTKKKGTFLTCIAEGCKYEEIIG